MSKRVTCTPGFLLLAGLLSLVDGDGVLLWAAVASAVHELGHYAAVCVQGGGIMGLRLSISGAEMTLDRRRPLTYGGELAAILAGPGASLLLTLAAVRLGNGSREGWILAGISLCLGWFNLLPIWPLDGGRALLLILSAFLPADRAETWVRICSLSLGVGMIAGGMNLFLRGGSPMLAVMGIWILLCGKTEEKK